MMEEDLILKLQAFVDGELPESGQAEIAALIARDSDVNALVKELKQTRQALASFDEDLELPESREFYWSNIEREINQFSQQEVEAPRASLASILFRWLMPVTCVAGLVIAGLLFFRNPWSGGEEIAWQAANDGVSAFTYHDYEEGTTLVWLSYPSDNVVANSGEAATIN